MHIKLHVSVRCLEHLQLCYVLQCVLTLRFQSYNRVWRCSIYRSDGNQSKKT